MLKIGWVLGLLLGCSIAGFSQAKEIKITFIGNCGLHLTDGSAHLYVDFPYKSGAHNYMEYDPKSLAELEPQANFLFTHKHADHYSKKLLGEALQNKGGQAYGPWNLAALPSLKASLPDFEIEAFRTVHRVFGISFKHYSYLITWHGKRIYLSGDTESANTIGQAKAIDWAFVPAWLLLDANEKQIKIDAQKVGIYHIGPRDDVHITGEKVLMFKAQGQQISIPF